MSINTATQFKELIKSNQFIWLSVDSDTAMRLAAKLIYMDKLFIHLSTSTVGGHAILVDCNTDLDHLRSKFRTPIQWTQE